MLAVDRHERVTADVAARDRQEAARTDLSQVIDEEVARILHSASDRAIELLEKNRDKLEILARSLEEQEVLDELEIERVIGTLPMADVERALRYTLNL